VCHKEEQYLWKNPYLCELKSLFFNGY
jgi:hypothetical protein